jgi:hypothetical protein
MWGYNQIMAVAKAIREEIVRQYREDERRTCPAGADYYEEEISPYLIAEAVEKVIKSSPGDQTFLPTSAPIRNDP